MTGAGDAAGNAYPSEAPDFPSVFIEVHAVLSFVSLFHVIVLPFGFCVLFVCFV